MNKKIKLKIVTPEKLILEEYIDQVTIPSTEGELTVLPMHIPMIASLSSGDVVALNNGEYIPMAVSGGFVEVKTNGDNITEVAILADFAEHVSDLTDEAIEKAKERAEKLRKQAENEEIIDFEHFESELERNLTRIKIADKWRSKKYRK
jgi:F-type H+-transporting ATPase subunit epsilon